MRSAPRRLRGLRAMLLIVALIPLAYLLAAVAGALVPRNGAWQQPRDGVLIFVRDNGVHVDLVLPARAAGVDLYQLLPPAHIADPNAAQGWIALGWGQRELYLETPYWRDLTVRNALRSAFGGRALMHVEHMGTPWPSAAMRPLRLDPDGYRRLVAAATADFIRAPAGTAIPLTGRGYGAEDVFYEARGRYHGLRTCNQWSANRLAGAGVRVGVWTPFAQGLIWRF